MDEEARLHKESQEALDEEDKITLKEAYTEMLNTQKDFEKSQEKMIKTLTKYKVI